MKGTSRRRYSGWQMKFNKNNFSFNFSGYTKTIKKMQYTIEKPYKMVTRNATFQKKFSTFVRFLGQILENQCFRKMGVAGMKWGPRPPILYSFFRELNEEALLKVSLKNLHLFQSYPFFKNTTFSKMALKIYQKLKN